MAVISFVSSATPWTANTSGTGFTINAPAGVAAGDLMLALLAFNPASGGAQRTITVPAGWTKVDDVYVLGSDNNPSQICVMSRQATASEPASWSGTISTASPIRVSGCVAYRSVLGILAKGTAKASSGSSYSTATVNNTKTGSWRVTLAAYSSGSLNYSLTTNETTSRVFGGDGNTGTGNYVQIRMGDSNAAIATGNTSRTVSRSAAWSASTSWIGVLELLAGTPAAGIMSNTLSPVGLTSAGEIHDDAVVDIDLKPAVFTFAGAGQPVVGTGTFAATLPRISVAAAGHTAVSGVVNMLFPISIAAVGETRSFGIRVIEVEFDTSRLITVQPRAVDD